MAKTDWKPGNMLFPIPAVMVSVGNNPDNYNIITIAWTGTICSNPPMCYISVRKSRYSYKLLKEIKDFVINITTAELAKATDWCGVRSGSKFNKFKEMNLTPGKSKVVNSPIILESPINIECKVTQIVELGSHDMFMAEVVNVKVDEKYIDAKTGEFKLYKASPLAYSHGHYYELGKWIGKFGFSVEKKKNKKKNLIKKNNNNIS